MPEDEGKKTVTRWEDMSEETRNILFMEENSIMPRLRAVEEWKRKQQRKINLRNKIIRTILVSGLAVGVTGAIGWFAVQKLFM